MLPTFLIIGAAKSGTTSLFEYLSAHPKAFLPKGKELDFFSIEENWTRGVGWYEGFFAGAGGAHALGEASPSYTAYPHLRGVARRIRSVIPDARLIYLLRHPVERMLSHYLHDVRKGQQHRPIEKALTPDSTYVARSRYAMQLNEYLRAFPRTQILTITAEALRRHRPETLRRVFDFVGVDAGFVPPDLNREHHITRTKREPRFRLPPIERLQGRRTWARMLPKSVRSRSARAYRRIATRPIRMDRAAIDASFRRRLEDGIRDDVRLLRDLVGPQIDVWGLL